MINESTWHRDPVKQTNFVWEATELGIELHHSNPSYIIPWTTFHAVYRQASVMGNQANGIVTAGTSMTSPTPGSVGEWVLAQNLPITDRNGTRIGNLTPRHLSFMGPILGRMGFIQRQMNGNSIQWFF